MASRSKDLTAAAGDDGAADWKAYKAEQKRVRDRLMRLGLCDDEDATIYELADAAAQQLELHALARMMAAPDQRGDK